jgi:hypothetical protein
MLYFYGMKKLFIALAFLSVFHSALSQREGIQGQVFWISRDQPGPGTKASPDQGTMREILVYKATVVKDANQQGLFFTDIKTELVQTVMSSQDGSFKIVPRRIFRFTKEQKDFSPIPSIRMGVSVVSVLTPKSTPG